MPKTLKQSIMILMTKESTIIILMASTSTVDIYRYTLFSKLKVRGTVISRKHMKHQGILTWL